MVEVPSFLRRCYKFPRLVEHLTEDWCSPSRLRHRKWGRAFELTIGWQALLETEKGAFQFFRFLRSSNECGVREDFGEGEWCSDADEDSYFKYSNTIIWMNEDVFIFAFHRGFRDSFLQEYLDHGAAHIYEMIVDNLYRGHLIIEKALITAEVQGSPVLGSAAPSSPRLVEESNMMNVLLRLVAKHGPFTNLTLKAMKTKASGGNAEFPASLDTLKAFVSETQNELILCLQSAGLSPKQWNSVIVNCNKHVTIQLDYEKDSDRSTLVPEVAILHHCPTKLDVQEILKAPPNNRQMIFTTMELTTSLKDLSVMFEHWNKEKFFLCMNSISRNRSITTLCLWVSDGTDAPDGEDLTLQEWELFCGAITSHPTLQDIQVFFEEWRDRSFVPSAEKDDILINMVSQNTLLVKFDVKDLLHNEEQFHSAVDPVLDFNRFRRLVQRIKQETKTDYRQKLFTSTLLSNRVFEHPAHRYLLLKENFDLMKQSSSIIEDILLSDWEMTKRLFLPLEMRMRRVENRMRERGVAIPTSLRESEVNHGVHGRKAKRSRCSS